MILKNKGIQLCIALLLGIIVILLPRPEGIQFKIVGDDGRAFLPEISEYFQLVPDTKKHVTYYIVKAKNPGSKESTAAFLEKKALDLKMAGLEIKYVDGLSPKAKRFLAILAVLVFLFIVEPIPLEITAICIGVFLVIMRITDVKSAWAPYMHPVVVFIMCCLIFAISLDKAGLTKRLGHFIVKKRAPALPNSPLLSLLVLAFPLLLCTMQRPVPLVL